MEFAESVAPRDVGRRSHILVEVDGLTHRKHGDTRRMALQPARHLIGVGRGGQHRLIAVRRDLMGLRDRVAEPPEKFGPIHRVLSAVEAELAPALGHRRGVDRQPRRIGAALRHAGEHGHHERPQLMAQGRFLHQQTDNSTHAASPKKNRLKIA